VAGTPVYGYGDLGMTCLVDQRMPTDAEIAKMLASARETGRSAPKRAEQ
jgi:hypothetical protein